MKSFCTFLGEGNYPYSLLVLMVKYSKFISEEYMLKLSLTVCFHFSTLFFFLAANSIIPFIYEVKPLINKCIFRKMASYGINFNDGHGDHDKLLEKGGTFSTSGIEISTKSSLSNIYMEKDIETDEQQRVELFHSTSGLDLQGPYMIHTTTFEEVQAYLDQCLQNACWDAEIGSFR